MWAAPRCQTRFLAPAARRSEDRFSSRLKSARYSTPCIRGLPLACKPYTLPQDRRRRKWLTAQVTKPSSWLHHHPIASGKPFNYHEGRHTSSKAHIYRPRPTVLLQQHKEFI